MYLSGLNAIIAMFLTKNVPYRNFLYPAMILGILIPDLDSLLVFIADFFLNISLVFLIFTLFLLSFLYHNYIVEKFYQDDNSLSLLKNALSSFDLYEYSYLSIFLWLITMFFIYLN